MNSVIIFCAKYLVIAVLVLSGIVWLRLSKRQKLDFIAVALVATFVALLLDKISGKLYFDPRPFVSHNVKPLVAHIADNGFPSEHTLFGVTLATVTLFYNRKIGIISLIVAIVVGVGRVAAHVHSPIDIVSGAVFGLIAGYTGYYLYIKNIVKLPKSATSRPPGK